MTTQRAIVDKEALRNDEYANDKRLQSRGSIYAYATSSIRLPQLLVSLLPEHARVVVDVGCGNGLHLAPVQQHYVEQTTVVGIDISAGVMNALSGNLVVADATQLPLRDNVADVAMAMHMLYHLPNPADGINECARVLTPSGAFFCSTNGTREHLSEVYEVVSRVGRSWDSNWILPPPMHAHFDIDTALELTSSYFGDVEVVPIRQELVIPDTEPLIAYIDTLRLTYESSLPEAVTWQQFVDACRREFDEQIAGHGPFETSTHTAIFHCKQGRSTSLFIDSTHSRK